MNKIFSIILVLILSVSLVSAATITPQKGLNLRSLFNLTNVNHIDATEICFGIDCKTAWPIDIDYDNVTKLNFDTNPIIVNDTIGDLYWDNTYKTLQINTGETHLQIGQESYTRVYNDKNFTILNGEVVYIDGAFGIYPTAALALANNIDSAFVTGVATNNILPGETGFITNKGIVNDLDTSAFSVGAVLYLSDSVAGGVTDTKPLYPYFAVTVGIVLSQNATTGSILVVSRIAENDPIWNTEKGNYYTSLQVDNLNYGNLKNTSLNDTYIPYYINGSLQNSPISYQVTDEQFINFFDDRSMYLDSTYGVGGINIPATESHKANWQVTSKMVPGVGLLTTGAYDPFNDETIVTNTVNFGDNIDSSSNIFVNNVSYFTTEIPVNNTIYVRGNVSFTNQAFTIKIAPYIDVFGPSNTERGYSISDDAGNWQWGMYIPDNSNNTQLCFDNRIFPNGDLLCLHDNGDVNVEGTLIANGLDLGNSTISVFAVNANILNGTLIYINNTDLQSILNGIYGDLLTKLNITDQRYNDTALIQEVNLSIQMTKVGGNGTNMTIPIWTSNNTLGDSPISRVITDEDNIIVYNGDLYIDDTNGMVGINVPVGSEQSHAQAFTVQSEVHQGPGTISSTGQYDIITDSTLVDSTNILPESFVDASSFYVNGSTYYVFSVENTTAFRVRGNWSLGYSSNNWTWRQAPYIDVNGPADSERGYTISSDGVWQWAIMVPDNSNNSQICIQNRNAWFSGVTNAICIDTNGDTTINGNLVANSVQFPKYSGFVHMYALIDNGNGSVTIPSNQINCYKNNDYSDVLTQYDIAGGVTGVGSIPPLVPNLGTSIQYIVGDCGPTGTTPTFTVITDLSLIDNKRYQIYSKIIVGNLNLTHIQEDIAYGTGLAGRAFTKDTDVGGYELSITTPLALTVNNSYISLNGFRVWAGYTPHDHAATDNSTSGRYAYYFNSTVRLTIVNTPPWFNDSYYPLPNGTLVNFTPGYYGIIDVWRLVDQHNEIYMFPMTQEYTNLAEANAETNLVTPPIAVTQFGIYAGRIIFESGNTSNQIAKTFSPINNFVTATPTSNHNSLSGLEGGSGGNYYHLGQSDYVDITNHIFLNATDQRYNDTVLANSKAFPGNCPSGQAVQNTTTGGVQCIPAGNTYLAGTGIILTGLTFSLNDTYVNDRWNYTAAINLKLNITDQRYNDTALINAVNTTANIKSLGFNTTAELDTKYVGKTGNQSIAGNVSITSPGSCLFFPSGAKVCSATGDTCLTVYSPNGLTKARVCN